MTAGFGLSLEDVPAAEEPRSGEVRLQVEAAGICGTDVHIYEWSGGYEFMEKRLPLTIGHEFSGRIAAMGDDVEGFAVGDFVTVVPPVFCGKCSECQAGRPETCRDTRAFGTSLDGGFQAELVVPVENVIRLPAGLDPQIGALAEPFTVAAEAVANGDVKAGDRVLVLGPGFIGQAIALLARDAGADVFIAGKDDESRASVLDKLGFRQFVDIGQNPLSTSVTIAFGSELFDVVFEATGVPSVVPEGLTLLKERGVFVVCGIHPAPALIDLTRLVRWKHQLRGTQRALRRRWQPVIDFLHRNQHLVRPMITHHVSLEDFFSGIETAHRRIGSKVMVHPGGQAASP
ncbi:zinc-dependent alcohol dehydrogenase [Neorhizobium sp. DT-125]|uniref:zinc-dependent alcohol dehydrogenase n=1 Tax=Neorhizobium sp. DT-125 TaxID=3396163 RepID=UPI003F1979A1